ncbi:MAG: M15 family metallopeptidase [Pseudomonadota bacterium]
MRELLPALLVVGAVAFTPSSATALPAGFVYLSDLDPTIEQDIRYAGPDNFIGRPIAGYRDNTCILTRPAARALVRVQRRLRADGLTLRVYDCFRPVSAVNDFRRWAAGADGTRMRAIYYPRYRKSTLFRRGFIARRSAHSRGSAVDLAITRYTGLPVPARTAARIRSGPCHTRPGSLRDGTLDFGTAFDCFHPLSATDDRRIGPVAQRNRQLLKRLMAQAGFRNYRKEWWHYTLNREPFPRRYFDFPVQRRSSAAPRRQVLQNPTRKPFVQR